MSIWNSIKNFFFPVNPEPTYTEQLEQIIVEEKAEIKKNPPKPRKPRAKKVKNENT